MSFGTTRRNRILYCVAVFAVIGLGLASRRFPVIFPAMLGKYPGDALWALMIFFALGMVLPRASCARIFLLSLTICYAVEFFKFYQAPWIMTIRYSTIGHLIFGHTFSWQNLVAYLVGAALGLLIELGIQKNDSRSTPSMP